jgi:hypothetical protein
MARVDFGLLRAEEEVVVVGIILALFIIILN